MFYILSTKALSITDQLNLGMRVIEIDIHYFAESLRVAHCSELNVPLLKSMATSIKSLIELHASPVIWDSSLFGCLPSLSGIKANEQITLDKQLSEIESWIKSNGLNRLTDTTI